MQSKKQYRKKQQPCLEEREELLARVYRFTTQSALARVFKCTPQQVRAAFDGSQPTLMNKLKNYVENFEQRNSAAA